MITHRKRKTRFGLCWAVSSIAVVDAVPELLRSGLPVFDEQEFPIIAAMDPVDQERAWARRAAACVDELRLRDANPKRTVAA